jgi:hypothetical protein
MVYLLHPLTKSHRISHERDSTCINFKKATIDFKVTLKASARNLIVFICILNIYPVWVLCTFIRAVIGTILLIVSK